MTGWILEKCEDAWVNYLSGSITSSLVNVYRGNEEVEKDGPAIICFANDAEEVEFGSGIYRINMLLHMTFPYTGIGSLVSRNNVAGEFTSKIYNNSNIVNELTGSTNNLNILSIYFQAHNNGFEGDSWVSNNMIDMIVTHT
jgi:hypothetical protein